MFSLSLKWRFVMTTCLVVTFVSAFFSYSLFDSQKRDYFENVDAKLLMGVQMARYLVGADFHDALTNADSVSPADYLAIVEKYNDMAKQSGFQFLWSNLFLPDGRIVVTSATSPSKNTDKGDHAGFFDTHPDSESFRPVQLSGEATYSSFSNKWGKGRMLLVPFQDKRGRTYVFGAGIATDELDQRLKSTAWKVLTLFVFILSVTCAIALALGQMMVRPIQRRQEITEADIAGKTDQDFQGKALGDDGHPAFFETTKTPLASDKGELKGVLGISQNVITFREQEKASRLESEKNQAILRNTSDGIHILDLDADGTSLTGISTVQDITSKRALIDASMMSEQRLSFALQGSNDGLWDWNLENNDVYFSPRWLEMVGYAEGELPQKFETWELLVHPDDKARTLAAVADYVEGRTQRYEMEFRLRHKQGHWQHILSRAKWACDRDGQLITPRRLVGTHVDLTDRKRVEQALAHQVAFTESLINAQHDGVSACSEIETYPFVRFTVWNKAMEELTGYSLEEINRLGWYQTVYADEQTQQQAQLRMNRMRQGEHLRGEKWTITRKNGERRTVQIYTSLVTTHDGKPHVLAVMHDVSDQIRALTQLRESEERLRVLYEESADAILLMENDTFIDCNKSAQNLLGLKSRHQIRNFKPSDISPEYQPDGQRSDEKAADMIAKTIDQGNHLFEWEHIAANGRSIKVEVMLTVVMHHHKPIMHVVWRDLSQLHSALVELQKRDRYQRAVLDNFPFLVWLKDEESRYLAVT